MKHGIRRFFCAALISAVLVSALTTTAGAAFRDVPSGYWAAPAISRCVELGFFQGQSADRFGVGAPMARGSFAVVLCRFFGWETVEPQGVYQDVPGNAWYAGAVESAYQHGAFTRQSDRFEPTAPITREELAVTLCRALGYSVLAGLAQEQAAAFKDVTTNPGYIAVANELGLMSGTSSTIFSPNGPATREQVAVILMRLYDKLHARPQLAGAAQKAVEFAGCKVVALDGGRLAYAGGKVFFNPGGLSADVQQQQRSAAKAAGAKTLMTVTGKETILRAVAKDTAALLAQQVESGSYDGLYLDLTDVTAANQAQFTALAKALRTALGKRLLYVAADAPNRQGSAGAGYDWAALSTVCDKVVVRIAAYQQTLADTVVAPPDPMEEVYSAVSALRKKMPAERISLRLNTACTVYQRKNAVSALTAAQADALIGNGMTALYNTRYDCAYLTGLYQGKTNSSIWYLNGQAVEARLRLAALFGVNEVFISDLGGLPQ